MLTQPDRVFSALWSARNGRKCLIFSIFTFSFRDTWKEVENMSADEAKSKYIEALLEMFDNAGEQVSLRGILELGSAVFH